MKRYNQQKRKFYFILIMLFILSIGLGYASLTETLTISNSVTISEMKWDVGFVDAYDAYDEFVEYVSASGKHTVITSIAELNSDIAEGYAAYMRTIPQAVDTHNRKIKRLRKIFDCLSDYYSGNNPFKSKTLLRSPREECFG
jgi:hypothetical protein